MRHILPVILSSILFVDFSFAVETVKKTEQIQPREYGEDVAKSVAVLLKSGKNLKGFLGRLGGFYTSKDIRKTKELLLSKGFSQKSKLPSFKRKKSRIIFDKKNYIDFIGPNLVVVNGMKVRMGKGDLHTEVNRVITRFESKQKISFIYRLLFSQAHALSDMQGILAAVAGGAVGVLGGEYFGMNKWLGGALGVGAVYLVAELFQSYKDGDVSCASNGKYQIRSKDRNSLFMATSKHRRVSNSVLQTAGLRGTSCTEERAAKLQSFFDSDHIIKASSPSSTIQ